MKSLPILGTLIALASGMSACSTNPELHPGLDEQPYYPASRSPATQPSRPSVWNPTLPNEDPYLGPTEDPDSLGTTRSPRALDENIGWAPENAGTVTVRSRAVLRPDTRPSTAQ